MFCEKIADVTYPPAQGSHGPPFPPSALLNTSRFSCNLTSPRPDADVRLSLQANNQRKQDAPPMGEQQGMHTGRTGAAARRHAQQAQTTQGERGKIGTDFTSHLQ